MEHQTKSKLLKKLISVAGDKNLFCNELFEIIKHGLKLEGKISGSLKNSTTIKECLNTGILSKTLSCMLSEGLEDYYDKNAFLLSSEYLKAVMICLSAVEKNQLSLLHQIDIYLYDDLVLKKGHKRSTSQPQIILSPQKPVKRFIHSKLNQRSNTTDENFVLQTNSLKYRPWRSMTSLYQSETFTRPRSKTVTNETKKVQFSKQTSEPVPCFKYKFEKDKSAIRPITIHHINCENIQIHEDVSYRNSKKIEDLNNATSSSASTKPVLTPRKSLLNFFNSAKPSKSSNSLNSTSPKDFFNFLSAPAFGEKLQTKNVLMQAIASDSVELRRNSPRRKVKATSNKQSLANFIQTIQNSCSSIELDRENAHFLLSEALIGTFEQVKWNQILSQKFELLNQKPDRKGGAKFRIGSADSEGSSAGSSFEGRKLDTEHLSEAQIEWGASESHCSAESIALTLINKFNDKQLPSACEVLWLVSESQAPQKLLPIPNNGFVINPDEHYGRNTIIRGTNVWAAPRAQIIFTLQSTLDRKQLMVTQQYRCHGCGMKISKAYANKMRFCHYFSKLNCSGCHKNQISMIPAKILQKWDFELYNVSVFAYQLLDEIYNFPLFRVDGLKMKNKKLEECLKKTKDFRISLKFIQDFINNCRLAKNEHVLLQSVPGHITDDIDIWTISDFVEIKNGVLPGRLQNIVKQCEEHIIKCQLCTARGFICEICKDHRDIIFPFQKSVNRCGFCGSCFHISCWNLSCSKCERLKRRQMQ